MKAIVIASLLAGLWMQASASSVASGGQMLPQPNIPAVSELAKQGQVTLDPQRMDIETMLQVINTERTKPLEARAMAQNAALQKRQAEIIGMETQLVVLTVQRQTELFNKTHQEALDKQIKALRDQIAVQKQTQTAELMKERGRVEPQYAALDRLREMILSTHKAQLALPVLPTPVKMPAGPALPKTPVAPVVAAPIPLDQLAQLKAISQQAGVNINLSQSTDLASVMAALQVQRNSNSSPELSGVVTAMQTRANELAKLRADMAMLSVARTQEKDKSKQAALDALIVQAKAKADAAGAAQQADQVKMAELQAKMKASMDLMAAMLKKMQDSQAAIIKNIH